MKCKVLFLSVALSALAASDYVAAAAAAAAAPRTALLIVGQVRTLPACVASLRRLVLGPLAPVDVFWAVQVVRESPADAHALDSILSLEETTWAHVEFLDPTPFRNPEVHSREYFLGITESCLHPTSVATYTCHGYGDRSNPGDSDSDSGSHGAGSHSRSSDSVVRSSRLNATVRDGSFLRSLKLSGPEAAASRAYRAFHAAAAHARRSNATYAFAVRARPDLLFGLPLRRADLEAFAARPAAVRAKGYFFATEEGEQGQPPDSDRHGDVIVDDYLMAGAWEPMRRWYARHRKGKDGPVASARPGVVAELMGPGGWAGRLHQLRAKQVPDEEAEPTLPALGPGFSSTLSHAASCSPERRAIPDGLCDWTGGRGSSDGSGGGGGSSGSSSTGGSVGNSGAGGGSGRGGLTEASPEEFIPLYRLKRLSMVLRSGDIAGVFSGTGCAIDSPRLPSEVVKKGTLKGPAAEAAAEAFVGQAEACSRDIETNNAAYKDGAQAAQAARARAARERACVASGCAACSVHVADSNYVDEASPACKPCLPLLSTLSTEQLAAAPPAVRRKWGDHPCKFVGFFGDRGARPEELPHDVWAVVPHMAGRGNTRHLPVPWPNGSLPA